jgi:GTPase SAR1 family protein
MNGFVFLFSVDDRSSFERIETYWSVEVAAQSTNALFILVANKIDLDANVVVTPEEGIELAKRLNMKYYKVSA